MDAQLTPQLPPRIAAPAVLAAGRVVGLAIAAAGDATIARGTVAAIGFGVNLHDSMRFFEGPVLSR